MTFFRVFLLTLSGVLIAGLALADSVTYWDEAPVVKSVPVYDEIERREPVEHCRKVALPPSAHADSPVPMLIGGIIGGVIGHQIGGGTGQDAATAVGVVLGSAAGHDSAERADAEAPRWRRDCEVRDEIHRERHLSGYRVTYRYRGELYDAFTETPPGDTLRLAVRVTPAQ